MEWLAYLVTRRDIFVIPTTNCYGYIHIDRADEGPNGHHDPNRDYPYSRRDAHCLQTNSALMLHALFAKHTVQLLVTFHGGMAAIAYEWGTPGHPHPRDTSPDDLSHATIAHAMRDFAGKFNGEPLYPVGTMNSLVYPVDGGLEDWAYAAGWDTGALHNCSNNVNTRVSNRAVVFLVETSDAKIPPTSAMGQDDYVLSSIDERETHGGHVPRNTRLGLLAVDVMQPYVCVSGVRTITGDAAALEVEWYVGGSQEVKNMRLSWHNASSLAMNDISSARHLYDDVLASPDKFSDTAVPPIDILEILTTEGSAQATPVMQGKARWAARSDPLQPSRFTASVPLPVLPDGTFKFHLHVWAAADCEWSNSGQGHPLNTPPQAHLSNTRCNERWRHRDASGTLRVQGRKYYPSDPIVVNIKVSYGRVVSVSEKYIDNCKWWEADYDIFPPADSGYFHGASTKPPISLTEEPKDKVFIKTTVATERYFLYVITLVVVTGVMFVVFQSRLRNRFLRLIMPMNANNGVRAQESLRSTVRHYEV